MSATDHNRYRSVRRLPAEWEPQQAVLLTWPHPNTDWAPQLPEVEAVYVRLATLIARRQLLFVICRSDRHRDDVKRRLAAAGVAPARVALAIAASDDTWTRDHGPLTVLEADGSPRIVDCRFNGWGGKHPAGLDDRITAQLHAAGWFGDAPLEACPLVLEGGAIDSDGEGTLLAVRRTLVDPARNPGWSVARIEAELAARLGVRRCLWLDHGQLDGDDTDGHIDTLARFCAPDLICHLAPRAGATDAEAESLNAMVAELQALRRPDGSPYRLVPLPSPARMRDPAGAPLPAGYANFLIINGAVLLPTYADPADALAAERLASLFPDRSIEPVDCRPLIRQGGSLHCVTMQVPAGLPIPVGSAPPA
jgi:agmatine/peptidylarginine deiminase